jgi:hypothetical protein
VDEFETELSGSVRYFFTRIDERLISVGTDMMDDILLVLGYVGRVDVG